MAKAKVVNYTAEQEAILKERYKPEDSQAVRDQVVEELEVILGKKKRSIRSKLTSMGLYVKAETVSKVTGEAPAKKEELAGKLVQLVGKNDKGAYMDVKSVAKLNKVEIAWLFDHITNLQAVIDSYEAEEFEAENLEACEEETVSKVS